jgi:hypothetical protein
MAADSVKFINYLHINDCISGYYIDPFELKPDHKDRVLFKNILKMLFLPGGDIFILCAHFTGQAGNKALQSVHDSLHTFGNKVDVKDEFKQVEQFCARIQFHQEHSPNLLTELWMNYKQLSFFKPSEDLSWNTFISYGHNLFQPDPDAKKMFTFDFMNFICIKGPGGESLSINHKNTYTLPELKDIILGKYKN